MCTQFTLLKDINRFYTVFLQRTQTTNNISELTGFAEINNSRWAALHLPYKYASLMQRLMQQVL